MSRPTLNQELPSSIKKIAISELRPGMYIQMIDVDWISHPFLRHQFKIDTEQEIQKINATGVDEVYIDVSRGYDAVNAPTAAEAHELEHAHMLQTIGSPDKGKSTISLDIVNEIPIAKEVQYQAGQLVQNIMQQARTGNLIDIPSVQPIVENITHSIFRNPGALLSLCLIKNAHEYTFQHSVSVCALMVNFCRYLNLSEQDILLAGTGALLHDIGKCKIPLSILNKPGNLNEHELMAIKKHPIDGYDILKTVRGIDQTSLMIAIEHHERLDGSGYPYHLPADKISYMAQIAAIVDVYDAMTSARSYHKKMEPTEVLRKLYHWSKHHFNPELVQQFMRCIGIYPVGSLVILESGRIAVVIEQHSKNLLTPLVRTLFDTRTYSYLAGTDIDLSDQQDQIVSYVDGAKWNISPDSIAISKIYGSRMTDAPRR